VGQKVTTTDALSAPFSSEEVELSFGEFQILGVSDVERGAE